MRQRLGIHPVFKTVDTLRGWNSRPARPTTTPVTSSIPLPRPRWPQSEKLKVPHLGSGPNRIGQASNSTTAVHAATTLSEAGFETVMVNCNPETVSTDYDTADRLYISGTADLRRRA